MSIITQNYPDFFDTIHNNTGVLPVKGTERSYNKYAPYYVYRYVKLKNEECDKEKESVQSLIASFASDIEKVVTEKLK